jgi:hypothetical protein
MGLDREQLEALKRQVEEDYRLDMAAIDRLQKRFMVSAGSSLTGSSLPGTPLPAYSAPAPEPQAPPSYPEFEQRSEPQTDELAGTLRSIFSSQRR